ncbi:MAG: type II toxin-antitoxin system RelE/ParE family toxin [Rhodocyclaceae bacterium]|nr:type II toxin-antitoxin system RelE/ParE family toxin [Rhodocyclaceae bacterium]
MIIRWLPRAIQNRDAQIAWIEKDSPQSAVECGDRLQAQVSQLLDHPGMGRAGGKQGTRELVISRTSWIVVFRVKPKAKRIEILRVLHKSAISAGMNTHR